MPAVEPPASAVAATVPPAATPVSARRCENCGAPLFGEHCHACGQPVKGLVRHFSSVLGDFFDTVFNIDSRVLRTVGPLLFKPGFLSLEYFAGRRVRYVTPTRLFLFLSLVMFFAIHGSIEINEQADTSKIEASAKGIAAATTTAQVEALRKSTLAELDQARKDAGKVPGAVVGIDIARKKVAEEADRQVAYLKAVEAAKLAGKPAPPSPQADDDNFDFPVNGKSWDPQTNPVNFGWLPAPLNASLNHRMGHARDVLKTSKSEKPLVEALFNVLPQTLILLMPIFALMLKLAYWFKRRLYMEHLIVALHSHSFISLAMTLLLSFKWLQEWFVPTPGFWNGKLGWAMGMMAAWIPFYLLLMQKRIYGQGWLMTLIKYGVLGLCYTVLLSFALVGALLVGLLTL